MKGYITATQTTGGGRDEDSGFPIPVETFESDFVECQYYPNNRRSVGSEQDGIFQMASYEITIDRVNWDLDQVTMITLYNSRRESLTQKSVLTLDELDDIQRVKITI